MQTSTDRTIRVRRAPKVGRRPPRREASRLRAAMALAATEDELS